MKKAIGMIIVLMLAVFSSLCVYAVDDNTQVNIVMPESMAIGEEITVTLSVSSPQDIAKVSATIAYDASRLSYVSGDGTQTENGSISIEKECSAKKAEAALKFKVIAQGNTSVSAVTCSLYDASGTMTYIGSAAASGVVTEQKQTEQTTAATEKKEAGSIPEQGVLKDLKIDKGTLIPPFMYSIHDYTVTVPYEIDKIEIEGTTASKYDNIWYTGNADCVVGTNLRTITVTDINGNETVYKITITRLDKEEDTQSQAVSAATSKQTQAVSSAADDNGNDKNDDLKNKLMPALYIALIVLIVALFIVIMWIKGRIKRSGKENDQQEKKTQKQRSKIKVSSTKKK